MKKARVAKQKAQIAKAKISAAKSAAPAPSIQQAPYPKTFTENPPPVAARYVPGLMVPGNESLGYKKEFGGGGWVAGVSDYNGSNYNSIADIKDWYKAMAATGNSVLGTGSWNDIRAAAATYGSTPQSSSAAGSSTTQPNAQLSAAKNVKSLKRAGAVVSKKELTNIMRSQNLTAQQVLTRAGQRGVALGAGVVNAANKGKFDGSLSLSSLSGQTNEFVQGMKGLTLSKGQQYSGTYEADGKQVPIVQARSFLSRRTTPSLPTKNLTPGSSSGQTDYGVRPMSEEEKKILTADGSTPRWIPNLNAPGTENYDPQYGGGGWVSTKGVPGGSGPSGAATDEFMKAYSKATTMAKQLGQMGTGGDVSGVYNLAKMFDERQAQQPAAGLTGYSQPTQAGTAGESTALSGGKVQKLKARLQKTKTLIKSSKSELAARGF